MKNRFLIITLVLACLLRLGFVFFYPHETTSNDSVSYHNIAMNLLNGDGYSIEAGVPSARRAPVYPLFLAALYAIFGTGPVPVEVAQALTGALTCLFAYLFARELFNETAGRITLVFTALYPISIAYCGLILTETVFTFFLVLSAYLFVRAFKARSLRQFFLFGISFGLTNLVRPDVILVPFFLAAILLYAYPGKLKAAACFGMLLLGMLVPFFPWSAYNYSRFHMILPGHSGGLGPLVYSSADYAAKGTTEYDVNAWKQVDSYYTSLDAYRSPEKTEKKLLAEGIKLITDHPGKFAFLIARRLPKFWLTSHSSVLGIQRANAEYKQEKAYFTLAVKSLLLLFQAAVLILACFGLVTVFNGTGPVLFLCLMIAYPSLYVFVDTANRHHVPFMPFFFICAGIALMRLTHRGGPGTVSKGSA